MKIRSRLMLVLIAFMCVGPAQPAMSQFHGGLGETPAVSGYEQQLAGEIRSSIKGFSPQTDNLGNVYVTLGSGAPQRMIVAPIDQPGYVVSEITAFPSTKSLLDLRSAFLNARRMRFSICCTRPSRFG